MIPLLLLLLLNNITLIASTVTITNSTSGRVSGSVELFESESDRAANCPTCPSHVTTYLDESPLTTANRVCSLLPPTVGGEDGGGCLTSLTKIISENQLALFIELGMKLDLHLKSSGVDMPSVEGKSFTYLEKIKLMQKLVHHPQVETICEVGFNAGHGTLLWLASGAKKVLSFELGQYTYSTKAISFLSELYPNKFQVIMGDSLKTVPSFHDMFPEEKCNILFVDGGHLYEHAYGDMGNFRSMRNESFHYLVIDDTNQEPVQKAWGDYRMQGLAKEEETVWSDYSEVLVWKEFQGRPIGVEVDGDSVVENWRSSMSYGVYL
ncbi:hypothetical protein TL16_g03677 [Triparma laevis f. inornata]|uniref:Uncharacterized protein n=1 Tax=Triparma laevis f. inornata TaxID=1714386 RepID=A0A9W7E0C6_9STRA|nr:hypothetical protein TL16_g03677 [Triparma laevis f. inornata]